MRVRHCGGGSFGHPLVRASRARRWFPFVTEQVLEKAVAPFGRRRSPGDLQAARDRVGTFAGSKSVLPAEALLLKTRRLGFGTNVRRRNSAVSFAKCMTAGDERRHPHRRRKRARHRP